MQIKSFLSIERLEFIAISDIFNDPPKNCETILEKVLLLRIELSLGSLTKRHLLHSYVKYRTVNFRQIVIFALSFRKIFKTETNVKT